MTLRFGECELDIGGHELRREGLRVAVEPQVFDVLAYLAEHRERVVAKTELLDEIWGDRFVSESALTSRIKSARRAVGDSGREQRVIRTIHGRGFRFVADVDAPVDASPPSDATTPVEPAVERPADPRFEDLASGIVGRLRDERSGIALELTGASTSVLGHAVDEIYDAAARDGALVGRGSGAGAGLRPYGCVLDAVDELTQRSPAILDPLPHGCRDELDAVLSGRQPSIRSRLFLAVRELLVEATDRQPVVLAVAELDYADPDTISLLQHCVRLTRGHPLAVVAAHQGTLDLGVGYERCELPSTGSDDGRPALPPDLADVLRTVALEGSSFPPSLFEVATGLDEAGARRLLDRALAVGVIEATGSGRELRFSEPGLADDLAAELAPHRRAELHRILADRLVAASDAPGRIAHHLLAAHDPKAALPFALAAAREANAAHRYPEVLRWTAAVLDEAFGVYRRELLTYRAAALMGTGDPTAIQVYRDALALTPPGEALELRAGLARAAVLSGDLATADEALAGISAEDAERPQVLLIRAMLAYFRDDLETAEAMLDRARTSGLVDGTDRVLDVISMQGLIAHNRGEWFDRLRRELRATRDSPELAITIFDSHLCVAEFLLYGPTPYQEVIALSGDLRLNAERSGARRAVAFAACVTGEAKLLAGDLDSARVDLEESVHLHRELGADAGTAHSLQRLAELELASGDPTSATALLREALVLARWSAISQHLLQRIYGTLIAAAPDRHAARAMVDEAADVADSPGSCEICQVMISVPAAIACAEVGHVADARTHLERARWSSMMWEGTAWQGAIAEAEASIALAEARVSDAIDHLGQAVALFDQAGQPLDAARAREMLADLRE